MLKRLQKKIMRHLQGVLKTKHSAHSIAFGFGVGTFIGILPTPGFNIALGLLIVFLFKKINKYALFIALLVWNIFTTPFISALSYKIGDILIGPLPAATYNLTLFDQLYHFSRRFLIGNFLLAVTFSVVSYLLVLNAVWLYRRRQKVKSNLNQH